MVSLHVLLQIAKQWMTYLIGYRALMLLHEEIWHCVAQENHKPKQ